MKEILAEASGRPIDQVGGLLADFQAIRPGITKDEVMTEEEYQDLRAKLRSELPGIRAWLARGAAEADPKEMADFRFQANNRN